MSWTRFKRKKGGTYGAADGKSTFATDGAAATSTTTRANWASRSRRITFCIRCLTECPLQDLRMILVAANLSGNQNLLGVARGLACGRYFRFLYGYTNFMKPRNLIPTIIGATYQQAYSPNGGRCSFASVESHAAKSPSRWTLQSSEKNPSRRQEPLGGLARGIQAGSNTDWRVVSSF